MNRNLALVGAALLTIGLFVPIVSAPMIGSVNLFSNGSPPAIALLILAVLSAVLAAKPETLRHMLWPSLAAAAIIIFSLGMLMFRLAGMRDSLQELEGNPFAGFAHAAVAAVQVQWGWLVLGAGAGLLIYAALASASSEDGREAAARDPLGKVSIAISALAVIAVLLAQFASGTLNGLSTHEASTPSSPSATSSSAVDANANGPTAEEMAYIRDSLQLYEFEARYFDSYLDGRVPGVVFKIKNNGNRTLSRVRVRVVFRDANDQPIAEEDYTPVSEYSYDGSSLLRPNYIWQQERGRFYTAQRVPSEWEAGNAVATITEIEFLD